MADENSEDETNAEELNDKSEAIYDILIENLNGEIINKVKNVNSPISTTEIVKNNSDKFSKKKLKIKRNDNGNLEVLNVISK